MNFVDFEVPDERDFSWTVGADANLSHCRMIDAGASGEVHEVVPPLTKLTLSCQIPERKK